MAMSRRGLLGGVGAAVLMTAWGTAPVATAGPAAPAGFTGEEVAAVDAAARRGLAAGVTGVLVSIADPRRGALVKAYGAADDGGAPLRTDSRFRIASVTKTFTADAVLRLVDRRRVALDDPISRYVHGVPRGEAITVRDLLGMRSGAYDFIADAGFLRRYTAEPTLPWSDARSLAIMRAHAGEFTAPDRRTVYVNSNYVLLGMLLEKVTGRPQAQVLTRLARGLGLRATWWPTGDGLPAPVLRGYLTDGTSPPPPGGYRDVTESNPAVPGAAGAMVSDVADMTRWAGLLASGTGLSAGSARLRRSWTPLTDTGVRLEYGLGVLRLGDWVGHDGAIFGYSNLTFHLPGRGATVVVAGNGSDAEAVPSQQVWGEIVNALYPGSLPTW